MQVPLPGTGGQLSLLSGSTGLQAAVHSSVGFMEEVALRCRLSRS